MDYQKSRRPKRIVGEGKGIQVNGPAKANRVNPRHNYQTEDERRYLATKKNTSPGRRPDQAGERPMATSRVTTRMDNNTYRNEIGEVSGQTRRIGSNMNSVGGSKSNNKMGVRNSNGEQFTRKTNNNPSTNKGMTGVKNILSAAFAQAKQAEENVKKQKKAIQTAKLQEKLRSGQRPASKVEATGRRG